MKFIIHKTEMCFALFLMNHNYLLKAVCACRCRTTSQTLVSNRALPPHFLAFYHQKPSFAKVSAKGAAANVEAGNSLGVDSLGVFLPHSALVLAAVPAPSPRGWPWAASPLCCYKTLPPA